jgi:Rrf2 family iron-sulfur cluster assembly transcriptional regulator
LALAKLSKKGEPISINTLAGEENISPVFLEQIFFKLRKAGIVSSVRGPGGGFCFSQSLDKLTVKEILDASGEDLKVTPCDKHQETCDRVSGCLSHHVWVEATRLVNEYLRSLTLASLLESVDFALQHEAS